MNSDATVKIRVTSGRLASCGGQRAMPGMRLMVSPRRAAVLVRMGMAEVLEGETSVAGLRGLPAAFREIDGEERRMPMELRADLLGRTEAYRRGAGVATGTAARG